MLNPENDKKKVLGNEFIQAVLLRVFKCYIS